MLKTIKSSEAELAVLLLRPAGLRDVPLIHRLLKFYSDREVLLPRSESDIYSSLRDFVVFYDREQDKIAGCASLQIYSSDLGEVRSLAVDEEYRYRRLGSGLVTAIEDAAMHLGLRKMMALTYEVKFFERSGYHVVEMSELPEKVWGACVNCHKFRNCDEIAVLKYLD
ncbi:MAG: N-acetyltransferase [Pseudomonadota bacterium]